MTLISSNPRTPRNCSASWLESSAYRDLFEQEWRASHQNNPILNSENLALTPMVFVMWADRREAFIKKYGKVNFKTVGQAM